MIMEEMGYSIGIVEGSNQNKFFNESYDRFTEMQENLRDIKIDISRVQKLHVDELELLSKQRKTRRKGK